MNTVLKATMYGFLKQLSKLTQVEPATLTKALRTNINTGNNKPFRVLCVQYLNGSWDSDLPGLVKEIEGLLPEREILG